MGVISLEGLEFFAYHGYYDEEQKIGSKFSIDIAITADLSKAAQEDKLKLTVNYEEVYRIIADVMQEKHRLLEHIAYKIIESIRLQFPHIEGVTVNVSKFNPPLGGICHRSKVTISVP
ncbi:dihydroneopterin aldolase [Emticicia oligotrophica DSM 17448]|uniref:7,8-dihydroneopterin aldolase n=1 Tax=Emticicia oligotrophica (strain DSM 17448 / CIP 109782 / MTCC 6937 / GPTSA100-15) TaxID=929562 RepID=A0ABM5N7I6_EMTOG|nr:dihydroneopterin aldolase [Emticicia oligotrophica]AFK05362.1 dihydroneopterin aldolase [Emticicia oligotrophica DSM 17448]